MDTDSFPGVGVSRAAAPRNIENAAWSGNRRQMARSDGAASAEPRGPRRRRKSIDLEIDLTPHPKQYRYLSNRDTGVHLRIGTDSNGSHLVDSVIAPRLELAHPLFITHRNQSRRPEDPLGAFATVVPSAALGATSSCSAPNR